MNKISVHCLFLIGSILNLLLPRESQAQIHVSDQGVDYVITSYSPPIFYGGAPSEIFSIDNSTSWGDVHSEIAVGYSRPPLLEINGTMMVI